MQKKGCTITNPKVLLISWHLLCLRLICKNVQNVIYGSPGLWKMLRYGENCLQPQNHIRAKFLLQTESQ